jgi:hypothetical protein
MTILPLFANTTSAPAKSANLQRVNSTNSSSTLSTPTKSPLPAVPQSQSRGY